MKFRKHNKITSANAYECSMWRKFGVYSKKVAAVVGGWVDELIVKADKFASEERTMLPVNPLARRSHAVLTCTDDCIVFSVVMDCINESERIIVTDKKGREYQIDINLIK